MNKDEALKLALQVLSACLEHPDADDAIAAIKDALAAPTPTEYDMGYAEGFNDGCRSAPAQEPVAYAVYHHLGGSKQLHWPEQHSEDGDANEYRLVPLYTTPPAAQRQWIGLTDEDMTELDEDGVLFARYIEAKLKAKNICQTHAT